MMENEKKGIYIESTIPSYATARESKDVIVAAHQVETKLFWERERQKYNLYVSQYVIAECTLGDPDAARRRLEFITGISVLPNSDELNKLASVYQKLLNIPESAKTDCSHLAACVVNEIDYLLTWNCTHLGLNAYLKVREYNEKQGLWIPLLITPEYFIGVDAEEIL
jgi:hypothetical protein